MYYTLNSVAGEPLRLNCRYRIAGNNYDADVDVEIIID